MQKSGKDSNGSKGGLSAEVGIDDDALSGIVGGAGTPTAAPSKPGTHTDDHLNALTNAIDVEPAVLIQPHAHAPIGIMPVHEPVHAPVFAPPHSPGPIMHEPAPGAPHTHGPVLHHPPVGSHDPAPPLGHGPVFAPPHSPGPIMHEPVPGAPHTHGPVLHHPPVAPHDPVPAIGIHPVLHPGHSHGPVATHPHVSAPDPTPFGHGTGVHPPKAP